jgi:Periplasmic copper-binding protein (NosD)
VTYSAAGGTKIINNLVEDSCLRFADGAAIYTWNGFGSTTNQSSLVQNNIVARAPGNADGSPPGTPTDCMGLYADDLSRQGTFRGNTIIDVPTGIYLHNAAYMTIDSNRIWLARGAGIWTNMDHSDANVSTGNVFSNNQINVASSYSGAFPQVPTPTTNALPIWFWDRLAGGSSITSGSSSFSNNEMLMLNGASQGVAMIRGGTVPQSVASVDAWRKLNPNEPAAKTAIQYSGYLANFGPELVPNASYANNASGWGGWFAAANPKGSMGLASGNGCSALCAVFSAGTIYDTVSSPSFSMNSGGLYLLQFRANLQSTGLLSRPNVSNGSAVSSGSIMGGVAGGTIQYQGFFKAASASPSKVSFSAQGGTKVGLENVSVKQVNGYTMAKSSDWASYVYTPVGASKTVDCAALGWPTGCRVTDAYGSTVALPFTLPAGSAKLLLRSDTTLRMD